jgi:hypothetical protein
MESIEVYQKCKQFVGEIKVLFDYYQQHQTCISVSYFNHGVNEVLINLNNACVSFAVQANTRNVNATLFGGNKVANVQQLIAMLEAAEQQIIYMLDEATVQRKHYYLYNFESCFNDARQLVSRMQLLIRNSQYIMQPYLKATA